jgi:hypothetical protein
MSLAGPAICNLSFHAIGQRASEGFPDALTTPTENKPAAE